MRIAVLPARGGSKRIPRKNVRPFAGKPMIAHPIECALASGLFDRVVVSTDDDEIASIAAERGAEVPFRRPAALADDHTPTADVIAHAIGELRAAPADAVCCIYPTAAFLRPGDLRAALDALESGRWEFVFAATRFEYPIFRSFRRLESGGLRMFFPEHFSTRSQDLPEALHDAAQFYWGRAGAWLSRQPIFGERSSVVMLPRWRVQDIDTPEDWAHAERLARAMAAEVPA